MTDLLQPLIDQGDHINMFPIHEKWWDISRMEDYQMAQDEVEKLEISQPGSTKKFQQKSRFNFTYRSQEMSKFLKGTYEVKKEIVEEVGSETNLENEFRTKAINSIGGSMVFVERNRVVWDGNEDEDEIKNITN